MRRNLLAEAIKMCIRDSYVTDEDGEETGEDVALDDTWNYTDILWNGIQACLLYTSRCV